MNLNIYLGFMDLKFIKRKNNERCKLILLFYVLRALKIKFINSC